MKLSDGNQRGGSRVNDYQESPSHHIPVDQTDTATLTRQTPQSGSTYKDAREDGETCEGVVKVPQYLIFAVCCVLCQYNIIFLYCEIFLP